MINLRSVKPLMVVATLFATSVSGNAQTDINSYFNAMSALMRQTIEGQLSAGPEANSLVTLLSVGISAEPIPRPATPAQIPNLYPYLNMRIFGNINGRLTPQTSAVEKVSTGRMSGSVPTLK